MKYPGVENSDTCAARPKTSRRTEVNHSPGDTTYPIQSSRGGWATVGACNGQRRLEVDEMMPREKKKPPTGTRYVAPKRYLWMTGEPQMASDKLGRWCFLRYRCFTWGGQTLHPGVRSLLCVVIGGYGLSAVAAGHCPSDGQNKQSCREKGVVSRGFEW